MRFSFQSLLVVSIILIASSCNKDPMTFENPLNGMDLEDSTGVNKGYLLEPFTSVNCGACPLAHHEIEELEAAQNDVFHLTHYMHGPLHHPYTQYVIDRVNKTVYTPLSFVQRANNNGSVVYYDVNRYNEILDGVRTSPVPYDLDIETEVREGSLHALVKINRDSDESENEVGLTAILVEKSVTGTGSGYDQRNYGHKDESHPYYGRGDYIKGFEHTNVIRYVLTPFEGKEVMLNQREIETEVSIMLDELSEDLSKYALIVFVTEDPSIGSPVINARFLDLAEL